MASKPPMKILIVGGVAGGMSAATRARRLDESASITVFEKGPYPSYANCGIPYALGGVIADEAKLLLQTPQAFKERFNIDVHVDTEAVRIDRSNHLLEVRMPSQELKSYPYDKLILSQGAAPFRPPIPGLDLPHVFALTTIPDLQRIKSHIAANGSRRVAIIGGGFIGLEAADAMRQLGMEISILEYAPQVFGVIDAEMAEAVHGEIRRHGVNLVLNARIARIEEAGDETPAAVVLESGERVPADVVLAVVGVRARTELAAQAGLAIGRTGVTVNPFMQTSDPDIYAVGDMVETEHRVTHHPIELALAGPANRQGRLAADNIYGRGIAYRGNVGTSVCKVFDLTVASTGLSVQTLRRMEKTPLWVTVHPPDHATYYPGAHALTLKVIFMPVTGLILGAQAVGPAGVDKRIDVLSTAMQAGMTVFDLEHLELAYAPPYGSAKDPVNMAGFVGANVVRGDVRIVHAEELVGGAGEGRQIVDVRSPGEFARGHIVGAVNVPLNSLREQVGMLEMGRPAVVYCQVGYRGYIAYRILTQMGFDVVNLDGGFKSVVEGGFTSLQAANEEAV